MPKQILRKTEAVSLPWSQTQVFSQLASETFQIGTAQKFNISYLMTPMLVQSQGSNLQHSYAFQLALKLTLYWTMSTIGSNPVPSSTPALAEVVTNFEDPANNSNQAGSEIWQGTVPVSAAFPVGSLSLNPGSYLVVVRGALQSTYYQGPDWRVQAPFGYLFLGGSA